jgi:hypothetical protein
VEKLLFLPARDLEDLGFKLALSGCYCAGRKLSDAKALRTLRETGTTQSVWHEMLPFSEVFNGLLGWDQALSFIDHYSENRGRETEEVRRKNEKEREK